jgi:bloom syndrome protein
MSLYHFISTCVHGMILGWYVHNNKVDYLVNELSVPAARLGSTIKGAEKQVVIDDLESKDPELRLVYVSPELLATVETSELLEMLYLRNKLSMFAIDECHCISSWGHDFRPAYLKLGKLKQRFPKVPMMALTATATKRVRDQIVELLGLQKPDIIAQSFDRPEIKYEVKYKELYSPTSLIQDIVSFVQTQYNDESGLVYASTRVNCQHVCDRLKAAGGIHHGLVPFDRSTSPPMCSPSIFDAIVSVGVYHAGLSSDERNRIQQ